MKRDILLYLFLTALVFAAMSLLKGWINIVYLPLWLGGLLGVFLPDIDHLVYVYFLRPHELTSQRVGKMMENKDLTSAISLVSATKEERKKMIFHSFLFQVIFTVLTFLVLTSSGSYFGRGLVLAFFMHLALDQWMDFRKNGHIDNWFQHFAVLIPSNQTKNYIRAVFVLLFVFAFVL